MSTLINQLLQNPAGIGIVMLVMIVGFGQAVLKRDETDIQQKSVFLTLVDDTRSQLVRLREDFTGLNQRHMALEGDFHKLVVERDNLRTELDDRNKRIIELEAQLNAAKARIATLEAEVKDLQSKVEAKA